MGENAVALHTATNAVQALGRGVNFETRLLYCKGTAGSRVVEVDEEHTKDLWLYDTIVLPNVSRDNKNYPESVKRDTSGVCSFHEWFSMKRKHALIVMADNLYYSKFWDYCKVKQLLENNEKGHVIATCRNPEGATGLLNLRSRFAERLKIQQLDLTVESTIEAKKFYESALRLEPGHLGAALALAESSMNASSVSGKRRCRWMASLVF